MFLSKIQKILRQIIILKRKVEFAKIGKYKQKHFFTGKVTDCQKVILKIADVYA